MYAEVYAGKVGFMLGIGAWRDAGAASGWKAAIAE